MMTTLLFPPKVLSIMPTWQCTASCVDCGTYSSPRVRTSLDSESIFDAIDVAAEEGFKIVVFTGGEATLRWSLLIDGICRATAQGLSTRLVTNGWWGKSASAASKKIYELKKSGLSEINFSTGDEHVRFVNLAALCTAIRIALDAGFSPAVMVEMREGSTLTKEGIRKSTEFMDTVGADEPRLTLIESPWMPNDYKVVRQYPKDSVARLDNISLRGGCDSIFNTYTLQANSIIGVCCGLGMSSEPDLQLGRFVSKRTRFHELAAVAETDLVKLLIKQIGPERLLARLATLNPAILWEGMYAHKCQACLRVFDDPAVIATINDNRELLFAEFALTHVVDNIISHDGLL